MLKIIQATWLMSRTGGWWPSTINRLQSLAKPHTSCNSWAQVSIQVKLKQKWLMSWRHYNLILWDRHLQWISGCPHSLTIKFSKRWWRKHSSIISLKTLKELRYPVASCDMCDHLSHWKYTITKYKIQMAVPTNTRVVLYASHVKLFAHTHIQALLLKLLFADVDNNTALFLS